MREGVEDVGRVHDVAVEDVARGPDGDRWSEGRTAIHVGRVEGIVYVAVSTPRGSFVAALTSSQADHLAQLLHRARSSARAN